MLRKSNFKTQWIQGVQVKSGIADVEAVRWYRLAVLKGDSGAQQHLAYAFSVGQGVEKNDAEAVKYYLLSAKQGNSVAQYNLGVICEKGYGVQKNINEAIKWYHLAAIQGNSTAQSHYERLKLQGY